MNLAVEIQKENAPEEPHLVFEIGDREAGHEVARILDWVQSHPDKVGFDDPTLKEMVENPDEPDSGIHSIIEKLEEGKPLALEGEIGKAVLHAVEVVAESDEMKAPQIPAIRILREIEEEVPPSSFEDVKDLSFADRYFLERFKGIENQKSIIDATGTRLGKVVANEVIEPLGPEPIWVDDQGRELLEGEYLRLPNAEASFAVQKAIGQYALAEQEAGRSLTSNFEEMGQHIAEGKVAFDLKGEEAQAALKALEFSAKEGDDEELQVISKKILETRKQGPKTIERVEVEPHHQIQYSGNQYDVKPDLKLVTPDETSRSAQAHSASGKIAA